jgi:hypothetical protein
MTVEIREVPVPVSLGTQEARQFEARAALGGLEAVRRAVRPAEAEWHRTARRSSARLRRPRCGSPVR